MKEKNIDVGFILKVLSKHVAWILIAAVVGGILGYVFITQTTSTTYTARVELVAALENKYLEDFTPSDDEEAISAMQGVSNLAYAQRLISTFMHVMRSSSAGEIVVENIKAEEGYLEGAPAAPAEAMAENLSTDWINWIGAGTVKNALTFSAIEDTNIFVATITTDNFYLTNAICKSFAETAPVIVEELCQVGAVKCFESSSAPYQTPVDVIIPTAVGAVAGAVIVAAIFVLISYLDDTIKYEEDMLQFQVLFLGGVPEINPNDKNELGKYSYGYGYGYGYGRRRREENPEMVDQKKERV